MYATERHTAIAAELQSAGRVSVADLAEHFDVTTETVRRDLDLLETAGVLRRVHGGAVPVGRSSVVELSVAEREGQHGTAKSAIARAAMRLVPPTFTGSIALDAGTTCAAVAAELARWEPEVAGRRSPSSRTPCRSPRPCSTASTVELHLLGGRVRGVTSAAVGTATVEQIGALRPDIAFIGTNGLSAGFGLSTPDEYEAAVKARLRARRPTGRGARRRRQARRGGPHAVRAPRRDRHARHRRSSPPADLAGALADAAEVVVA